MKKSNNKKIRNIIFLVLMILVNTFILFEACLPGGISSLHSGFFAGGIKDIINDNVSMEVEKIDVTDIKLSFREGDNGDFISGTTKRVMCKLLPENATNKAIKYTCDPEGSLNLIPQNGSILIEAMAPSGTSAKLIATAHNGLKSEVTLNFIERKEPNNFKVNIDDSITIKKNTSYCVDVDLSGKDNIYEHFGQQRWYDPLKVKMVSQDEDIASCVKGFIKGNEIGTTNVTIGNKTIKVNVIENGDPLVIADDFSLQINKDHLDAYGVDFMEKGDEGAIITPVFNENVTDKNVIFETMTPESALIDNSGHVYGNKKDGIAKIKATSLASGISKEIEIPILKVIPTSMEIDTGERSDLTQGQSFVITGIFNEPFNVMNKMIKVESSDLNIAKPGPIGDSVAITCINKGTVKLTITSIANPNLKKVIDVTFTVKDAINEENEGTFNAFIRKALGHFLLFFANGVITTLAMIFLLEDKKWANLIRSSAISLGVGFGVAWLSEFIQIFVKNRGASIQDVILDFSGFIIAASIIVIIFAIIHHVKNKNKLKEETNEKQ